MSVPDQANAPGVTFTRAELELIENAINFTKSESMFEADEWITAEQVRDKVAQLLQETP